MSNPDKPKLAMDVAYKEFFSSKKEYEEFKKSRMKMIEEWAAQIQKEKDERT